MKVIGYLESHKFISEYILVAFILKDKSDIPFIRSGMTSGDKEINIRGKELFF